MKKSDLDNVVRPCICFFENQIKSGLRLPPPPFLLVLANSYSIPLNQLHPLYIRRSVAISILCYFYNLSDALGLILSTHLIKHGRHHYHLYPKPDINTSFISHQSIDKDFSKSYFCVTLVAELAEWPYSFGQWQPILMAKSGMVWDLTDEEILLLQDLSAFYRVPQSFPLRSVTEDSHSLEVCGLFSHFSPVEIDIFPFHPPLLILFSFLWIFCSLTGLTLLSE